MKKSSGMLPEPCLVEEFGPLLFRVYQAKFLHNPSWRHPCLQHLVLEARQSYCQSYSNTIPLLDSFDPKSAIYLVSVSTQSSPGLAESEIEKWYSVRFIPGGGEPFSNEDLDFYVCQDTKQGSSQNLTNRLHQRWGQSWGSSSVRQTTEQIVTESRLCKFERSSLSATRTQKEALAVKSERGNSSIPISNASADTHAVLSFALMNRQFFLDCEKGGFCFRMVTCQMHLGLSNRILVYPHPGGEKLLPFTYAYKLLGFEECTSIRINRQTLSHYIYQYPGYFLELKALAQALQQLVEENLISKQCIEEYLPAGVTLNQLCRTPRLTYFRQLGQLLTICGPLHQEAEGGLSGESLRQRLDQQVPDGPSLRMMELNSWLAGLQELFVIAKTN